MQRTFTEMNICDKEICDDIEYYMEYLLEELGRVVNDEKLELDMQQVDLVIEPKVFDNDSVVCCYYFANHRDRCLFWLDDYDARKILFDCSGVESLSHIRRLSIVLSSSVLTFWHNQRWPFKDNIGVFKSRSASIPFVYYAIALTGFLGSYTSRLT